MYQLEGCKLLNSLSGLSLFIILMEQEDCHSSSSMDLDDDLDQYDLERLWKDSLPPKMVHFLFGEKGVYAEMPKAFSILTLQTQTWNETIVAIEMFAYHVAKQLLDSKVASIDDEQVCYSGFSVVAAITSMTIHFGSARTRLATIGHTAEFWDILLVQNLATLAVGFVVVYCDAGHRSCRKCPGHHAR
jgi:hypothetical protein